MRRVFIFAAMFAAVLGAAVGCSGGQDAGLTVEKVAAFPAAMDGHAGVAGAFIGVADDVMIIAGGSDFPGKKPWEGGDKVYYDYIWLLSYDGDGYNISLSGERLPVALGNGCAASDGKTVFCFGGNNAVRNSAAVYALRLCDIDQAGDGTWPVLSTEEILMSSAPAGKRALVDSIGVLPEGFMPVSAAFCGGDVYLHGVGAGVSPTASNVAKNGISGDDAKSASDSQTLCRQNALWKFNPASGEWTPLAGCPDRVIAEGAPLVALKNGTEAALYLIGGRGTDDDGLHLSGTIWEYLPEQDSWTRKSDIEIDGKKASLMYSGAVACGDSSIIVIGGDDGIEFSRRAALENEISLRTEKEDSLRALLVEANVNHGGFCDRVFCYTPAEGTWTEIGTSPHPLPVVTSAARIGGHILLPSGEIHPGTRTPDIFSISIPE